MLPRNSLIALVVTALVWQVMVPVAEAQESLADIVERCEQAVVKIAVEGKKGNSLGSGFVVDPNGTFVTNVHVLSGAQKATATFPNGKTFEITGTMLIDEARDICIAKLDGTGLPVLPVATALPRKGESVTALGSPVGLSFSATTGIVSAIRPAEELGPEIGRPEIKGTWIQVDAALSPGNSGGPLINNKGEVVGMSTLASSGGSTQNLNFGVSGSDILKLIETSRSQALVVLTEGVGKLEPDPTTTGKIATRPPIPKHVLEAYVSEGRDGFEDLLRTMRQELGRTSDDLKEMRRGKPFLPPNADGVEVLGVINPRTNKTNYFFRSQAVKDREVNRLQKRVKDLQAIEKSGKDPSNKESLFQLLSKCGPRLDTRREGSIGFMYDAQVLVAPDEHAVIVLYDNAPYLLWVESASGLFPGIDLSPMAVYVAGTQTVEIPGRVPQVVTLLAAVTEAEIKKTVYGDQSTDAESSAVPSDSDTATNKANNEYRTWKDSTGKFKVEATLVEVTDKEVVLKKRDGSVIKVPLNKLSSADRKSVGK